MLRSVGADAAAAAAWDGGRGWLQTGHASTELTGAPWVGAASLSMVAAATPWPG